MSAVIRLDDYRGPFLTIYTDSTAHVYPATYFTSYVKGEPVEPIPDDVLRVIVREWLDLSCERGNAVSTLQE